MKNMTMLLCKNWPLSAIRMIIIFLRPIVLMCVSGNWYKRYTALKNCCVYGQYPIILNHGAIYTGWELILSTPTKCVNAGGIFPPRVNSFKIYSRSDTTLERRVSDIAPTAITRSLTVTSKYLHI